MTLNRRMSARCLFENVACWHDSDLPGPVGASVLEGTADFATSGAAQSENDP